MKKSEQVFLELLKKSLTITFTANEGFSFNTSYNECLR